MPPCPVLPQTGEALATCHPASGEIGRAALHYWRRQARTIWRNNVTNDHVNTLKVQHADLEARLDEETRRPVPDQAEISLLKRQKLLIKDQIVQLERV